ncbi:hypothetical protein [Brevundimonas sp.]|uniref:hypothetical protein n=1 Tax=Brevundimonas sp. TaxID=1871086 RepID=UPI002EDB6330
MSILRRLIGVVFAAATLLAAPAALAQTYTIHRSFTAAGGVTGTATLEMANSTLTDADLIDSLVVPAELVSATLTFNNLGGAPASTTFNRGQLSGVVFVRDGGTIIDINFWAPANADGYALTGVTTFDTNITKGGYSVIVTTPRPPPPPSRPWANGR